MAVIPQPDKRYVPDPVSQKEYQVWDREECKHVGASSEDKAAVEYLCRKLNGEFKDDKKGHR